MDNVLVNWVVLTFFLIATGALAIYGLHLYVLVWLFRRRARQVRAAQRETIETFQRSVPDKQWPVVTTQIPLYNEVDVAERIIRAAAAMQYADGKHEIQVLDDSDDDSGPKIDSVAADLRAQGLDVKVLRRRDRTGYKAGALAKGVQQARGEYVVVFDADFVPPSDFLRRAIPLLETSPDLACLQGRWGHLNEDESWLTQAQAMGIDGHFAIEQGARAWNGLLMNFNGTAGVWRKAAIEDPNVGGWAGDTLTEDLDLSYRAQLAGWRMDYCFDLAAPAELPAHINAFKSQQRRWATGSIQVAVKLLPRIWRARLRLAQKVEATLHLTHYTVSVWMLILALLARPMLFITIEGDRVGDWLWVMWAIVFVSAVAPATTYGYARYVLGGGLSGVPIVPQMMVLGCGMCLNNALAVFRGLKLRGGEFVRTPKSGTQRKSKRRGSYKPLQTHLWAFELVLGAWTLFALAYYLFFTKWVVSVFMLLYGAGFITIGWLSRPVRRAERPDASAEAAAIPPSIPAAGSVRTSHV
jgi:cellulose synthase/poly-beta-1,6-N-acetylglucosamine synthase-like glycosyltransferase